MSFDINNHPCFNDKKRHTHGRIHLPVAPRCNIQCNFCNRNFDCVNESRPGVSSGILTPEQALVYLNKVMDKQKNISVVGIAGPGDPFANPEETMQTLRLVRNAYPDILLCLATNGLNLDPYIEELAELNVSHVTITINGVEEEVVEKVYSWIRYGKRVRRGNEAAKILLEKQLAAVKKLKDHGITTKINSILIPGINDTHIPEVAKKMKELNADIFNCIPLYKNKDTLFEHITPPTAEMTNNVRKLSSEHIKQMSHCARCRADAVGLIGEATDKQFMDEIKSCSKLDLSTPEILPPAKEKPYIACASQEGVLINQHLGESDRFWVYARDGRKIKLVDIRKAPAAGSGTKRWEDLCEVLSDCSYLLVSGAGGNPRAILERKGLKYHVVEGVIHNVVSSIYEGESINHFIKTSMTKCGEGCSGGAVGCG